MSPQQIEALAALVAGEMDKKVRGIRSAKELDAILVKFAEGTGRVMKKQVAESRDRLLGLLSEQGAQIAALQKRLDALERKREPA